MTERSLTPLAHRYRTASGALAVTAMVIGTGIMVGWLWGVPRLTDWVASAPEAKFNAGLCVLLLGAALWLVHGEVTSGRRRVAADACAASAVAIALLTIGEVAFGWRLGIDNFVVREPAGALGALAPGRMAPHAALLCVLVGTALLLLDRSTWSGHRASVALGALAALGALFVAEGYIYGMRFFSGPGAFSFTALPLLAGMVALSLGLLVVRSGPGSTAVLAAPGAGGRMARRLVPVVVLVPIALGALQVTLVARGLFAEEFALALTMTSLIAISLWAVLATARTIEARAALEAAARGARQAAADALRESEARFRSLFESMTEGFAYCRMIFEDGEPADFVYLDVNAAFEAQTRLRDVVGRRVSEVVPGIRAADPELFARYARVATTGVSERFELFVNALGDWFDLTVYCPAPEHFVVVFDVITERKRLEAERQELNAELERLVGERTAELALANQDLEAFSYSVSHDLRAPLRAVDGFSRILVEEFAADLAPEAQRYLGLVRGGAQQMGRLVDDLLDFARLGRRPVRRQRVETAGLVAECLRDLAVEYGPRAAGIVVDALPPCDADPVLLRQVWMNLLANACKFTRDREPAEIRVGCRDGGGTVVYHVSDNGVGFDMAYAHKLFGVFQRLHRAEEYAGTGVGLALVQRIVHRHGGRIWAEAAVDRGATFHFTLGEEAADGPQGS